MFVSLLLLACSISTVQAQDDNPDNFYATTLSEINPKHSFTMELGLPVILGNKFNRSYMAGLVYFAPYYQFTFENHLAIGAGAFLNYTQINSIGISENIWGSNTILGGFGKIAYEKFYNARFGMDMGVKMGFAHAIYQSNKLKEAGRKSTGDGFYVEPNVGLIVTVAEKSSFRFFVGYNFLGMPFDNHSIAMESDGGMAGNDFKKFQQHLTFGFGYTFYAKTR